MRKGCRLLVRVEVILSRFPALARFSRYFLTSATVISALLYGQPALAVQPFNQAYAGSVSPGTSAGVQLAQAVTTGIGLNAYVATTGSAMPADTRYSRSAVDAAGVVTQDIFSAPVNYQSADDSWAPIQTELVESDRPGFVAENDAGPFSVLVPEDASDGLVRVERSGSWVEFGADEAQGQPDIAGSSATFGGGPEGPEFRYDVTTSGVKETVVLDTAPEVPPSFDFDLRMSGGLRPRLTESGEVIIEDGDGSQRFSIPAPFMTDSASAADDGENLDAGTSNANADGDAYSDQVSYELLPTSAGDFVLRVLPDYAWLSDPARVYPVKIDPPVQVTAVQVDCTILQASPSNSSCGTGSRYLRAGLDGSEQRRRSLVRFNISSIPSDARVSSAKLNLYLDSTESRTSQVADYVARRVTQSWNGQATWSTRDGSAAWSAAGGSFAGSSEAALSLGGGTSGFRGFEVTDTVKSWISGSTTNNGLLVRQAPESTNNALGFFSSAVADTGRWPRLTVTYTRPPTVPSQLQVSPCTGTCSPLRTNSLTPLLSAVSNDVDSSSLNYVFQLRAAGGTETLSTSPTITAAPGTRAEWRVPNEVLLMDQNYEFRVGVEDDEPSTTPRYSAWSSFAVGSERPTQPGAFSIAPCTGDCSNASTSTATPTIAFTATDSDSDSLTYEYETRPVGGTTTVTGKVERARQGTSAGWLVPVGAIRSSGSYEVRARALDNSGAGAWSSWSQFTVALPSSTPTRVSTTSVISSDTVWPASGSPYILEQNVSVVRGGTLTIEAGAVIKQSGASISVAGGTLNAYGTRNRPIVFTSVTDDSVLGDTNGDGSATAPAAGAYGRAITVGDDGRGNQGSAFLKNFAQRFGGAGSGVGACQTDIYTALLVRPGGSLRVDRSEFLDNERMTLAAEEGADVEVTGSFFDRSPCSVYVAGGSYRDNIFGSEQSVGVGLDFRSNARDMRVSGNVFNSTFLRTGSFSLDRDVHADVRNNAIYSEFHRFRDNPTVDDLQHNWWGRALGEPGCVPNSAGHPEWNLVRDTTNCGGDRRFTGWKDNIVPALDEEPPFPDAGLEARPVEPPPPPPPAEQHGQGSEFGNRGSGEQSDPVNSATGSYVAQVSDAEVPTIGVPIALARSYNSTDMTPGPLGRGWSFAYEHQIERRGANEVAFTSGEGQLLTFTRQGEAWVGKSGVTAALVETNGQFQVRTRGLITYSFAVDGKLTSVRDRNDQGLTFSYDAQRRMSSIGGSGRTVSLSHNASGLLSRATLADGRFVSYLYSGGNLTAVRDLAGETHTYSYDGANRLTEERDAFGELRIKNAYDEATGRVTDQWDARGGHTTFTWNSITQTSVMTDAQGGRWTDTYYGGVINRRVDPLGRATIYSYDEQKQLLWTRDPGGDLTQMRYDQAGNIVSSVSTLGMVTTTYDQRHNPVKTVNARGLETAYGYDGRGNLVSIKRVAPNGANHENTYERDARGLLLRETNPAGDSTQYVYSNAGDLLAIITAEGRKQTFDYDILGRLTVSTDPRGNVAGNNPEDYRTSYTYNDRDQITTTTNPLGDQVTTTYNEVGEAIRTTDSLGRISSFEYDNAGQMISSQGPDATIPPATWTYDLLGNVLTETDQAGRTVTHTYDGASQLTTVVNPVGTHTLGYDNDGNVVTVDVPEPSGTRTQRISFTYNEQNRPTRIQYPSGPLSTFTYDVHGNRTGMTDAAGTVQYAYDAFDRPKSVTRTGSEFEYQYDANGQISDVTGPAGSFRYGYDRDQLLKSVTNARANGAESIATYERNAAGQPVSATLGNGASWSRTFDPAGRLATNRQFDGDGEGILDESYSYDRAGNPTTITSAGVHSASDTTVDTYSYDDLDRLTGVCYNTTPSESASCAGASDRVSWTYDQVGNRTSETRPQGTTTYSYASATGLLSSVQPPNGANATAYVYDRRGRLTRAGNDRYSYNSANQLIAATVAGVTASFSYDGDGRRTSATTPAGTSGTIWDPFSYQLVAETGNDANNNKVVTRRYVSGLGLLGFRPEDSAGSGGAGTSGWSYLHTDLQGSTRVTTGPDGSADSASTYEPYGVVRDQQDIDPLAPEGSIGWAGELSDATTGASHLRAREYDPYLGAFTTPDPIPATSYSATRVFANANPMVYSDPMGTFGIDLGGLAETVNKIATPVAAVAGVGALLFPPLAPVAAVAGVLTAASSLYLAHEQCTSGKGSCGSAIGDAALDSVMGLGPLRVLRSGARVARAGGSADDLLPGLPASAPSPLRLGSTGPTTPLSLKQQLAMTEVRSAPGGQALSRIKMTDPRWPASDGWVKMQQIVNGVNIHYVRNTRSGAVDDFKFKSR